MEWELPTALTLRDGRLHTLLLVVEGASAQLLVDGVQIGAPQQLGGVVVDCEASSFDCVMLLGARVSRSGIPISNFGPGIIREVCENLPSRSLLDHSYLPFAYLGVTRRSFADHSSITPLSPWGGMLQVTLASRCRWSFRREPTSSTYISCHACIFEGCRQRCT